MVFRDFTRAFLRLCPEKKKNVGLERCVHHTARLVHIDSKNQPQSTEYSEAMFAFAHVSLSISVSGGTGSTKLIDCSIHYIMEEAGVVKRTLYFSWIHFVFEEAQVS